MRYGIGLLYGEPSQCYVYPSTNIVRLYRGKHRRDIQPGDEYIHLATLLWCSVRLCNYSRQYRQLLTNFNQNANSKRISYTVLKKKQQQCIQGSPV